MLPTPHPINILMPRTIDNGVERLSFYPGQLVLTCSGRLTTPVKGSIRRDVPLGQWLIDNAVRESAARNDHFNHPHFKRMTPKNLSPADVMMLNAYLFDPSVLGVTAYQADLRLLNGFLPDTLEDSPETTAWLLYVPWLNEGGAGQWPLAFSTRAGAKKCLSSKGTAGAIIKLTPELYQISKVFEDFQLSDEHQDALNRYVSSHKKARSLHPTVVANKLQAVLAD